MGRLFLVVGKPSQYTTIRTQPYSYRTLGKATHLPISLCWFMRWFIIYKTKHEELACVAQEKWLGPFGRNLEAEFQIDPFTLKVSTTCGF